jgi:hypothetical protein
MGTKNPKFVKPSRDKSKSAKEKNPEGLDPAYVKFKKACSYKFKPQDVKLLVCLEEAFSHKFSSIGEFLEKVKSLNECPRTEPQQKNPGIIKIFKTHSDALEFWDQAVKACEDVPFAANPIRSLAKFKKFELYLEVT